MPPMDLAAYEHCEEDEPALETIEEAIRRPAMTWNRNVGCDGSLSAYSSRLDESVHAEVEEGENQPALEEPSVEELSVAELGSSRT